MERMRVHCDGVAQVQRVRHGGTTGRNDRMKQAKHKQIGNKREEGLGGFEMPQALRIWWDGCARRLLIYLCEDEIAGQSIRHRFTWAAVAICLITVPRATFFEPAKNLVTETVFGAFMILWRLNSACRISTMTERTTK